MKQYGAMQLCSNKFVNTALYERRIAPLALIGVTLIGVRLDTLIGVNRGQTRHNFGINRVSPYLLLTRQFARMLEAAGVGDHFDLFVHHLGVIRHAWIFLFHHQAAL